MSKSGKTKATTAVITTIIGLLVGSSLLRFGTVGIAIAEQDGGNGVSAVTGTSRSGTNAEASQLLVILRQRSEDLDALEVSLMERERALDAAELVIRKNLVDLEEAEERLRATVANVDGASADDIARLTAMYEAMKPKTAVPMFEQMTPDFAAGFLSRMRADAAAGILAGLPAEHAYAISVVMAGRNANAPTD